MSLKRAQQTTAQRRLTRRLNPDHFRVGFHGRLQILGVVEVHKTRLDAVEGGDFGKVAVRATVDVVHRDQMGARGQQTGNRCRRDRA